MQQRGAVLAIGAVMVDVVSVVPHLPASGEGVVAEVSQTMVGGCALNSANVARQLGAECLLFAPVGEGIYAGFVERALAARGFDIPLRVAGFDNGSCTCLIEPGGERTMITTPGAERFFERSWFDCVDAPRFACGLASGYEIEGPGGNAIISFFEDHPDIQFYYAPGPRIEGVGEEKTARINALHAIWHLNDQEACSYTGCATIEEAAAVLVDACKSTVVITAGSQGAQAFEASGVRHSAVPTRPVQVVDTVGAGDAHLGALVSARAAGYSWEDSLAVANIAAGGVCEVSGATLSDEEFKRLGAVL